MTSQTWWTPPPKNVLVPSPQVVPTPPQPLWDARTGQWYLPGQPQVVQQQQVMPRQSVHYEKKPMAHTAHLIMTILTAGLWGLFVWLPLGLLHNVSRGRRITTKYR